MLSQRAEGKIKECKQTMGRNFHKGNFLFLYFVIFIMDREEKVTDILLTPA